ncbi:hypothetical protein AVEN_137633-1 [Araneus ventricosus]|uniref:Uncharacterized protein n=1 Tax=Araneus ventricosus TaxID=182803 RepID=A0A4Y2UXJ8_ARAVE|nr:hypothetical protein AVEN_86407-1 [Araneus ventricosus]GBO17138.1 hypothetical protein AVEN_137633-1 [Araneus ventricosus]
MAVASARHLNLEISHTMAIAHHLNLEISHTIAVASHITCCVVERSVIAAFLSRKTKRRSSSLDVATHLSKLPPNFFCTLLSLSLLFSNFPLLFNPVFQAVL